MSHFTVIIIVVWAVAFFAAKTSGVPPIRALVVANIAVIVANTFRILWGLR